MTRGSVELTLSTKDGSQTRTGSMGRTCSGKVRGLGLTGAEG